MEERITSVLATINMILIIVGCIASVGMGFYLLRKKILKKEKILRNSLNDSLLIFCVFAFAAGFILFGFTCWPGLVRSTSTPKNRSVLTRLQYYEAVTYPYSPKYLITESGKKVLIGPSEPMGGGSWIFPALPNDPPKTVVLLKKEKQRPWKEYFFDLREIKDFTGD